ncbi:hypothetical protein [Micromonospora trifolii]|uniref:hypothetical protein n=1 Tax=Micromonospora trifolii TaxID=2911208 RepID=UPI003CF37D68
MSGGQQKAIIAVHVRGLDGLCTGCRAWCSRLTPYPCWQQARPMTAALLGGRA